MLKTIKKITVLFLCAVLTATVSGCYIDANNTNGSTDSEPPAIPRGIRTITGDETIYVEWYPNAEFDLDGYVVWRSGNNERFESIANLPAGKTHYTDRDVRNGRTYYYAVSAYDLNGNESARSPENAWDTPRPEGRNVTLDDYQLAPERSGYDFSHPRKGTIAWNDRTTDIYFGLDTDLNVTYLYSDNGTELQDLGYHENFDNIDTAPEYGYTTLYVELIEGHIYAIYTPDGNFAKIHVRRLFDDAVIFDWAYQTDPDNVQLAPSSPR